jgi:hypothetical protein
MCAKIVFHIAGCRMTWAVGKYPRTSGAKLSMAFDLLPCNGRKGFDANTDRVDSPSNLPIARSLVAEACYD